MTEAAQYDHIGRKYDEFSRSSTCRRPERHTILKMAGPLEGRRVLDLACGSGLYTRLLKERGAASVVGVDISPEMIRLAREVEVGANHGVSYEVRDASDLAGLGPVDLITAVFLLNYATTREALVGMLRGARTCLADDGRLIVYTMNPEFTLSGPNGTKYGITVRKMEPVEGGYACESEFVTDPPTPFRYYQWSRETYEWAMGEAGFSQFAWHSPEIAPEDEAAYGAEYWRDLLENGLNIGLVARR